VLCRCYALSAYVEMLRSQALRSRVRVSKRDGAAGSRLPALLALPHPQLFLRTIFARGSLSGHGDLGGRNAREIQENGKSRTKKRLEARESPQTVGEEPERAKKPRPVTVESQESVQRPWWRRVFGR
jgi:hypothetical protein